METHTPDHVSADPSCCQLNDAQSVQFPVEQTAPQFNSSFPIPQGGLFPQNGDHNPAFRETNYTLGAPIYPSQEMPYAGNPQVFPVEINNAGLNTYPFLESIRPDLIFRETENAPLPYRPFINPSIDGTQATGVQLNPQPPLDFLTSSNLHEETLQAAPFPTCQTKRPWRQAFAPAPIPPSQQDITWMEECRTRTKRSRSDANEHTLQHHERHSGVEYGSAGLGLASLNLPNRYTHDEVMSSWKSKIPAVKGGLKYTSLKQANERMLVGQEVARKHHRDCTFPSSDDTFPESDADWCNYTNLIHDAIIDCTSLDQVANCINGEQSTDAQRQILRAKAEAEWKILKSLLNEETASLLAWRLVQLVCNAQQGDTGAMMWTGSDGNWEAYPSFACRLEKVAMVLRESKQLVKNLLSLGDGWLLRVANSPKGELAAKRDNARNNWRRRTKGTAGVRRRGMTASSTTVALDSPAASHTEPVPDLSGIRGEPRQREACDTTQGLPQVINLETGDTTSMPPSADHYHELFREK